MDKLADNLRYYRKSKKYTQEEIVNKLDISTSAYGFYEQGRNTPPFDKLKQLSKLYGITLAELTGELADNVEILGKVILYSVIL